MLGTPPALGRAFTNEEDTGRQPAAILSDGLWRRKFGADASILGKPVLLDRRAYTVVGVMPAGFTFPNRGPHINNIPADVYVPISFTAMELRAFGSMFNNSVVARLKPGVSVSQARAEAATIAAHIVNELYPAQLREMGFSPTSTVVAMRDEVVGDVSRILYVLLAAVGVVLLIACADIACLMLTRAAAREREMAIRAALGAGRWRVMRLVLVETGVLAAAGGAAGLALAWWGQRALIAAAPAIIPRAQDIAFDPRVLGFTIAASVAAALICGVLPALESSPRESGTALKEGARTGTSSVRQRRHQTGGAGEAHGDPDVAAVVAGCRTALSLAGVALLLAALGIGGVLAISVTRRTQEIGIRLALGAHPGDVVRMVVRQGMLLAAAGLAIGLPCAFAVTRLLRSLLFETAPHDAVSFASATVLLCVVALLACAVSALRASRVSPITALRID